MAGLTSPQRPGSGRYLEESEWKFPFEAFEWDDFVGDSNVKLYLKSRWTLNLSSDLVVQGTKVNLSNLPVSSGGLSTGDIYRSGDTLKVVI